MLVLFFIFGWKRSYKIARQSIRFRRGKRDDVGFQEKKKHFYFVYAHCRELVTVQRNMANMEMLIDENTHAAHP